MNKRTWLLMLVLAIAVIAAPVAASAQACNPALYPPGIGFNPNVNYCLPNFAQSPNLRKFIDKLPGLGAANANNLGQYIPVAIPDTTSYPGSDYYEIGIKQYTKKMHTDLPATTLRGYYQKNGSDTSSQFLGAAIVAQRNRPVRMKYFNELPTGLAGNLFLPVDTTMMGAGPGPTPGRNFTQNRASVHLHGGRTPWISDGTPNQYITPALDGNAALGGPAYQKGLSFQNVPDMISGGTVTCIGGAKCFTPALNDGIGTNYYTNDQSARLMFYHDHAFGITRLNVYAGMAAPYILTSQAEEDLLTGTNLSGGNPLGKQILPDMGGNYHWGIPLVIEDKSFVNDATTLPAAGFPAATSGYASTSTTMATDPLWYAYVVPAMNGGSLWLSHEYMPIENIFDPTGNTPNGRWDYAPFLNPPMIPMNPTLPSPTIVPESFMDTMTVNGTVFPYVELPPDAVRFRILSVGNDRSLNLSWFKADPLRVNVTNGGSNYSATPTVTITGNVGSVTSATAIVSSGVIASINVVGSQHYIFPPTVTLTGGGGTCTNIDVSIISNSSGILNVIPVGCTGYTSPPTVTITGGGGGTFTSASATIIPSGVITGIVVTGATGYRSDLAAPTVNITDGTGTGAAAVAFVNTEVKMVDAAPNAAYPHTWPTDGRDGGVPDPATAGPPWIQIGNESGFLAQAAVLPANPLGYEQSRQSIPTLGVTYHSLLLMPAMRADVVVDFSSYRDGDVLILYNDGPAPMPGFWPLNDYYTDDPDQTGVGAAPSTPPGFGPNTRTVMQVRIKGTKTSNFTFDLAALKAALPKAFAADQDKPLVPQMAYNDAFPGFATFDTYASNKDGTLNLSGTSQPIAKFRTVAPGNGYTSPPTVQVLGGGGGTGAVGTAGLNPYGGLTLLTAGAGYTSTPIVTIGTPTSTYTAPAAPPVGVNPVRATAIAQISGGGVSNVIVDEPGSYYNSDILDLASVPTCTINPPAGCVINGTTCVQATCSSFIATAGTVGSIIVNNGGTGYTSEPIVFLNGGGGFGATADALLSGALVMTGKNITEGADPDYGRLDIRLGSTPSALTPGVGNGMVVGVARYIDPPTEMLNDSEVILWRITHLGVDSHSLHFHLFDMQIVNHVDYTNVIKPPYPDELGWREVIRTNPMEDIIVAIKPRSMALPFPVPRSNRLLDPTNAVNVNTNFLPIAPPVGIAAVPQITNTPTDFGWEYVWHCHILAHEENDMMRPMSLLPPTSVPPAPVLATTLGVAPGQVTLNWTITPTFTTQVAGFVIQRCAGSTCTNFANLATLINRDARIYTDATVASGITYRYQMYAFNNAGKSGNSLIRNAVEPTFGAPTVSMTSPVSGATFTAPATIPLSATATAGSGATITNVAFYYGTTNLISTPVTTSPYTVNWANVPVGVHPVTAVVTNSQGATATSAPITVNVITAPTTPPAASVTPPSLAFGAQTVGWVSSAQTVLVTNTGGSALTINSISFSGENPFQFAQTNNCPASLGAGANCIVSVTYAPNWIPAGGVMSASLDVAVAAPATSQSVALSATVVSTPTVIATPALVSFGTQTAGTLSTAQAVTVTNTGATPIAISSVSIGGTNHFQFTQTNNCPASLGGGTSCTVQVTFAPNWGPNVMNATLDVNNVALATLTGTSQ
jgi:FtsP/CotA-like multicopper oxidase with cupredoxin domain